MSLTILAAALLIDAALFLFARARRTARNV